MPTTNCSSGCPTPGAHKSWGECVRSKNAKTLWVAPDNNLTTQKQWQKDIDAFRAAKRQGINPEGSGRAQVERAIKVSNETGNPFGAAA
jgi:hypothetical protein